MKIKNNFLFISNHNNDLNWILEYTNNYMVYDRSDTDKHLGILDSKKVKKMPNIGWDIYDKFTYIIDNYENLPEIIILAKGNLFKYIKKEEFDEICNNSEFTPLLTKHHKTKKPISFYSKDGMYNEINNSWYLNVFPAKYFKTYNDFIWRYLKNIPRYIKFAPGSNYIVKKSDILRYPKSFYEKLRNCVDYSMLPGEAQIMERALYYMWSGKINTNLTFWYKLKNYMLKTISNNIFYIRNMLSKIKRRILPSKKPKVFDGHLIDLTEHKKVSKIYDIFTYNGEADILEIRLSILKDIVDQFIIVEAPSTFSGNKKSLYFKEHKERFLPFLEKIKYFVIDDYPNDSEILQMADQSPNVPKGGPEHWRREFYQKESIKKALTHLNEKDICFVGDVDEIWNPKMKIPKEVVAHKLKQNVYVYYLNNRSNEPWTGTLLTTYKNIKKNCLNHLRSNKNWTIVENGGWHFTSMGGQEEFRRKLNDTYTEESYNNKKVQHRVNNNFGKEDYLGRKFKFWIDESDLPKYILENKEKYKHLFK